MIQAPYAVFFDMDGVIFWSNNLSWNSFLTYMQNTHKKDGFNDHKEEFKAKTWGEWVPIIRDLTGIKVNLQHMIKTMNKYQSDRIDECYTDPALISLIDAISGKVPTAIITNSNKVRTYRFLDSIGLIAKFPLILTSADKIARKPEPDMLIYAAEHFNMPYEKCIYVGDSSIDRIAACNAGMPFLGYVPSDGSRTEEDVKQANIIAYSFRRITPKFLENMVN